MAWGVACKININYQFCHFLLLLKSTVPMLDVKSAKFRFSIVLLSYIFSNDLKKEEFYSKFFFFGLKIIETARCIRRGKPNLCLFSAVNFLFCKPRKMKVRYLTLELSKC